MGEVEVNGRSDGGRRRKARRSGAVERRLAHCYCPNQNCSALILDECGGNATQSNCPNCKSLFCFKCKLPWHAGLHCGELKDENDVAFNVLAKRNKWKRCPQCHHFVERIEGVVPISATAVEDELIGPRVIIVIFLGASYYGQFYCFL
uniref:Probable E3 ubiquitin-protein ligase RNF144A n=1 Tax=Nicotiana sylvestris TaxID=4096 RepID=A0A1U7UY71_NICSY|nr:PREDICTED: probable E3 ubiquitin-protein ligase RNF144A [Nicotiana sylvestris]